MEQKDNLNRRQLMIGAGVLAVAAGCSTEISENDTSANPQHDAAHLKNKSSNDPQTPKENADQEILDPDLTGVSILITGSSSGFGRLGAEYYARLGAKVFATMRNLPRPEARELEDVAKANNLDITIIEIDVTDEKQVKSGVGQALSLCNGKLDVLINNAGISYAGPIEVQDMAATEHIFRTNVYGPHRMARAVLPAMRKIGSGYIINVSSQLGRLIIPGFAMYSPTKFALEAMSEQMAYELVAHNIDVSIVQPGGYPTKIWENASALSGDLKSRLSDDYLKAYPELTSRMGAGGSSNSKTDSMDIPRATASLIAMAPGSRPLRKAVHPVMRPQEAINDISRQQQLALANLSPSGEAIKAVLD